MSDTENVYAGIKWEDYIIQYEYFYKAGKRVQNKLLEQHPDGNFSGLCDLASNMFIIELRRVFREELSDDFFEKFIHVTQIGTVHGELAHTSDIKSKYWSYQHTIALFEIQLTDNCRKELYIDLTATQFKNIRPYLSDCYIEFEPPYYMLLDKDNVCFKPFGLWLDRHFRIPWRGRKVPLMEFISYDVIGAISDVIYYLKHRKDK